jgi:hypothetical protein
MSTIDAILRSGGALTHSPSICGYAPMQAPRLSELHPSFANGSTKDQCAIRASITCPCQTADRVTKLKTGQAPDIQTKKARPVPDTPAQYGMSGRHH